MNVDDNEDSIDLTDITVEKRLEGEVTETLLSPSWGASNTESNRKDVAHLIKVWREKTRFYWIPLGSDFPGLDSVYRDGSKVYFVQVETEEIAKDAARWIEKAFEYSKLLLEALGNPENIEVALLVGSEPSKCPVLGECKRNDINEKHKRDNYKIATWRIQYVSAPSRNTAAQSARRSRELNLDLYEELRNEFSNFLNLVQDEEDVGNDNETGVAEPDLHP
jgi:hypothetical protein